MHELPLSFSQRVESIRFICTYCSVHRTQKTQTNENVCNLWHTFKEPIILYLHTHTHKYIIEGED